MNKSISPEIKEVMNAVSYLPCVSVIMPFEPKMNLKTELSYKLKVATDNIARQLLQNYEQEKANVVIEKLKRLLTGLNYDTYKKSIALYVSPVFEKVYYLDIAVEEKIIIDESFEIRDLVYSKKEMHKYLVLLLSAEWTKIFMGNSSQFVRVKTNTPDNVNAILNDLPERVANFSDPGERREIILNKFLKYTDDGLTLVLKAMPFPVFVMGTGKTLGYFKKLTQNERHILHYVPGNYEEASEATIRKVLAPYINDWKKVKQTELLHQLDAATGAGKLITGVENIWRQASDKNCRLLVVEKNFTCAARHVSDTEIIPFENFSKNSLFIKDAVDDIIEKVLTGGGDVEFVEEGLLKAYGKIALVLYY